MKTLRILPFILMMLVLPSIVSAQAADDKRKLKKELKTYRKMKPLQIKAMKNNYEKQLEGYKKAKEDLKASQYRADSLQTIVNTMNLRLKIMDADLAAAQALALSSQGNAQKGIAKGYYYRVQLGAYRNFDIKDKVSSPDANIKAESKDGIDKYVIGLFFNIDEADAFKNDIIKMGISDAFVVPYKDGTRITHQEARDGIANAKKTVTK